MIILLNLYDQKLSEIPSACTPILKIRHIGSRRYAGTLATATTVVKTNYKNNSRTSTTTGDVVPVYLHELGNLTHLYKMFLH